MHANHETYLNVFIAGWQDPKTTANNSIIIISSKEEEEQQQLWICSFVPQVPSRMKRSTCQCKAMARVRRRCLPLQMRALTLVVWQCCSSSSLISRMKLDQGSSLGLPLESHFRIDQSQCRHHTEPVDRRNEPQHKTTHSLLAPNLKTACIKS
jgi:hypothetical protein